MNKSNREIAIEVRNLSKNFRLPTEQASGMKQAFVNFVRGVKGYREQKVLRDISFDVEKGDFFGIVGRNGSGKSTLLKLISGIYQPDGGSIAVNGSLVSFIELGVGFNGELTGRENVYLNGALLGFSTSEVDEMYDEIVNFAELSEFMDQKLKNYSSGMQVRLAFACAIRAKSDILVLDEVLAVGDEAFQRKCNDYFEKIRKEEGKTVILVTHSMEAVRKYCSKAIMIRDGKIVVSGSPEDVANEYSLENLPELTIGDNNNRTRLSMIKDYKVEILGKKQVTQKDLIKIKVSYITSKSLKTFAVVNLQDINRNAPIVAGSSRIISSEKNRKTVHTVTFCLREVNDTDFKVYSSIRDENGEILEFLPETKSPSFMLRRSDYKDSGNREIYAVLFDRGKWRND